MQTLKLPKFIYFLFVISAICVNSELFAQNAISLSLNEAVDLALKNNTDVAVAGYQVSSSEYSVSEARGNYLPKLTLNGNYNRNIDKQVIFLPEGFGSGGATEIGSDNNFNTYLNLSAPLYSRTNAVSKEYAQSNFQLHREILRGIQQAAIADVKKNYFGHLVRLAVVQLREKALQNALENHKNVQNKLAQGVATEFDETSAKVKVTVARNALLEAQNLTIPSAGSLKLMLGIPIETEINLTDTLSLTEEELTFTVDAGELIHNSAFKQKELKTSVTRWQTSAAKAGYFPILSANGTYQFQSQQNDFNFSKYDWVRTSYIGLQLQIPIFNGTVTCNKVQQAVMAEKIADAQKEYVSRNNHSQFQQLLAQLDYGRQQIELQTENIRVTEKALSLVKERYNYGKGTVLEVNNAELEHITARLSYLQAVLDYKSAYYDYELLIGKEN